MTPRRAGRDTALYMLLSLPGWEPQCHMPIYCLGIPGLGCQPVEPSFPLLSLLKCLAREQPSPQPHKGLPACADKSTTSESPEEAGVKLGDWGRGARVPGPQTVCSTGELSTCPWTWGGRTQKQGQREGEEMAACSTAPLPGMQCDTRHQEMAAKVQGKNTQLFMAPASVVRSENRDLI